MSTPSRYIPQSDIEHFRKLRESQERKEQNKKQNNDNMKTFFTIILVFQLFLIWLKIDGEIVVAGWPWLIVLTPAILCVLGLAAITWLLNKIGDDV